MLFRSACRDIHGNLAAATSTGGLVNKRWGRVGDTPVVGAGVFADNDTCAVSATGYGEQLDRKSGRVGKECRSRWSPYH